MKYIIVLFACLLLSFQLYTIQTVIKDIQRLSEVKEIPYKKTVWVKGDIIQMIAEKAIENNLNPKYLIKLAECESSLNPIVQSKYIQSYGQEKSFGLFQIHLKAHTDVTVEQAKDPEFNTEWAIEKIKEGKAPRYWVHCHKVASKS